MTYVSFLYLLLGITIGFAVLGILFDKLTNAFDASDICYVSAVVSAVVLIACALVGLAGKATVNTSENECERYGDVVELESKFVRHDMFNGECFYLIDDQWQFADKVRGDYGD